MFPRIPSANILVVSAGFVKAWMLFSIQFGSSMKIAVATWLFKANAVACCTTLRMCLSSYIGWQMENPVNCVEIASVLELNTLSLGWAVHNSLNSGVKSRGMAILSFVTRAWLQKAVM